MDITIENRLARKRQATALVRQRAAHLARYISAHGQSLVSRIAEGDLVASSGTHDLEAAAAQLTALQTAVAELADLLPEIIMQWDITE